MISVDKHEMSFFIKRLLCNNIKWQEKSQNKDLLMDRFPEDVHDIKYFPSCLQFNQYSIFCLCHVIKCCLAMLQKMVALILSMKTDDMLELLLQREQLDQNIIILGLMIYFRDQCVNSILRELKAFHGLMSQINLLYQRFFGADIMHRNNVMQTSPQPSYNTFFMKVKFRLESFEKS